jgi:copper(I)-binding protein
MSPIKAVPVPAKAKIAFAPGGKHVMLFTINPSIKPGATMKLIFTFSNNVKIEYDAPVIGAGEPAPKR